MQTAEALTIRIAAAADLPALVACDPYAVSHLERRRTLSAAIQRGECLAAIAGAGPQGYVILTHNFFENGFVSLVAVSPSVRRRGIGQRLLAAAEAHCKTEKLFASTNASNVEAQKLLARAGFMLSGRIENLDEGDPELVYFKHRAALPTEL